MPAKRGHPSMLAPTPGKRCLITLQPEIEAQIRELGGADKSLSRGVMRLLEQFNLMQPAGSAGLAHG